MWALNEASLLPRTKKSFTVVSKKGIPIFIKPGKSMYFHEKSWHKINDLALLQGKVTSITVSPSGRYIAELPKISPLLVLHDTKIKSSITKIPLPNFDTESEYEANYETVILPDGTKINCSNPFEYVDDLQYAFNAQNKPITDFATLVESYSISDSGKIVAVLMEESIMIWNQLDDQFRGVGFWMNLNANQHFPVGFKSNDPNTVKIHKFVSVFDNGNEGRGACFLTLVLPPTKPFDTVYIYNSVCNYNFTCHPKFTRYSITLPVAEGYSIPRIWWSPGCEILVIAIAKSVVMLTRDLTVISILPLNKIFSTDDTEVAMVAWSKSLQYFIITTYTGHIGAITRSGVSLKHKICHVAPFDRRRHVPLGIYGDSELDNVFIIYSRDKCRYFRMEESAISQTVENILSLPFANKLTIKNIPVAKKLIRGVEDNGSIQDFAKMLFYTDIFRLFPECSPLRYEIMEVIKTFTSSLLRSRKNDALCYFLVRAVLRMTGEAIPALYEVKDLLSQSTNRKDRLLLRVLEDEFLKKDYVIKITEQNNSITFYDSEEDEDPDSVYYLPPHHNKDVDLQGCISLVKNLLFNYEFDAVGNYDIDLTIIMEMMIELGKFTRALQISQHPSIESNPLRVYTKIVSLHATDPTLIYKTMIMCIQLDYNKENEVRVICLTALLNIMRQIIADTAPDIEKRDEMAISDLCMLEEAIDLPIPEKKEECDDFGVIATLCFATAGFQNCSYFFNGKSVMIPPSLRKHIREIFRLLWFVRWRHNSFQEAIHSGRPGDATLRLLEFPEFIDVESTREMIEHCDESFFTPEIYDHYYTKKDVFELDPDFVDFACECSARITKQGIEKVSKAVLSFSTDEEDINDSTILLAAVVSHLVPWLRVSIPIAMVGVSTSPVVPNSLLDMEPYSFQRQEKAKMTIEKPKVLAIEPVVEKFALVDTMLEEEDAEEDKEEIMPFPEMPINKLPIAAPPPTDDYLSEGEEDLRPKKHKEGSKSKRSHKDKEKRRKKEKSKIKRREKPHLRLIDVEDHELPCHELKPARVPAFVPSPCMDPTPMPCQCPPGVPMLGNQNQRIPQYMLGYPMNSMAYGPLWDMDPALFNRYPKPKPDIPMEHAKDLPTYASSSVQANVPPNNTRFIMISKNKEHQFDSSTISDISIEEDYDRHVPDDPFPLDEELRDRVERLLKEQKQNQKDYNEMKLYDDGPVRGD